MQHYRMALFLSCSNHPTNRAEKKCLIFTQALLAANTVHTSTYKAKAFVIGLNGFSWQAT
jgi:hypothetical protein